MRWSFFFSLTYSTSCLRLARASESALFAYELIHVYRFRFTSFNLYRFSCLINKIELISHRTFPLQVDYKLKLSKEQLCAEVKVLYNISFQFLHTNFDFQLVIQLQCRITMVWLYDPIQKSQPKYLKPVLVM